MFHRLLNATNPNITRISGLHSALIRSKSLAEDHTTLVAGYKTSSQVKHSKNRFRRMKKPRRLHVSRRNEEENVTAIGEIEVTAQSSHS